MENKQLSQEDKTESKFDGEESLEPIQPVLQNFKDSEIGHSKYFWKEIAKIKINKRDRWNFFFQKVESEFKYFISPMKWQLILGEFLNSF